MAELFLGGLAVGLFLSLVQWSRGRGLRVSWWQWALTLLAFVYALFVAEVVIEFLREGTPKGSRRRGEVFEGCRRGVEA